MVKDLASKIASLGDYSSSLNSQSYTNSLPVHLGITMLTYRKLFRLPAMIAQVDSVVKWKICHMDKLDTWCKVER